MKKLLQTIVLCFVSLIAYSQGNFNIALRSNLPFPGEQLANIWGYAAGGKEYALVGTSVGMSIVDVTNPDVPVDLFDIPGSHSNWREIKTWQHYAYITSESWNARIGGVTIVDLSQLPNAAPYKYWNGDAGYLSTHDSIANIHSLHIDNGYLYLYGGYNGGFRHKGSDGAIICNLNDPWNPVYEGQYDNDYIHDGYVYHDTLWAANIYKGFFSVIDVKNKTKPVLLQTQFTPTRFTHNTWLSDNKKTLFTTDENSNSYLTSFDVSDINNIKQLGAFHLNNYAASIVHNTYVLNDYAVNSWYREGVVIVDAHEPDNLVMVGHYDTSPQFSGSDPGTGYNGCWGVYAYLPSGNLIASDIENGLYVLTPTYKKACRLEGIVTDSITGDPISDVHIQIVGNVNAVFSGIAGEYKTGTGIDGSYSITYSALPSGYLPRTVTVSLSSGAVTSKNIKLLKGIGGIDNSSSKAEKLNIYPNPVMNILNISLPVGHSGDIKMEITDIYGRMVKQFNRTNSTVVLQYYDVSDLASGYYVLKGYNAESSYSSGFVKE